MPVIEWKDEFTVGVSTIDSEHKRLIELINEAREAVDSGASLEEAEDLRAGMELYAAQHFATEETLMTEHGYPDSEAHLEQHSKFIKSVEDAEEDFADDAFIPGTVKIVSYLADWLVHHILETDKKLGEFLKEQGVE